MIKKKSCYLYSNNKLYKLFEFQEKDKGKKRKQNIDYLKEYLNDGKLGQFSKPVEFDTSEQPPYNHFFDYYIDLF